MKMWMVNMKIWIVTIICCTVSCKVIDFNDSLHTSADNSEIKHRESRSSAACSNCEIQRAISPNSYDGSTAFVNEQGSQRVSVVTRDGDEGLDAVDPPSGKCRPELQIYVFADPSDKSVAYYPTCTRVNRCNGCCDLNGRSCQPTTTKITKFRVLKTVTSELTTSWDQAIIPVIEHVSCECQCIVKRESCMANQEYDAAQCKCNCRNTGDRDACMRQSRMKRWNMDTCSCVCRIIEPCPTGSRFHPDECRCVKGSILDNVRDDDINVRRTHFMNGYNFESVERLTKGTQR